MTQSAPFRQDPVECVPQPHLKHRLQIPGCTTDVRKAAQGCEWCVCLVVSRRAVLIGSYHSVTAYVSGRAHELGFLRRICSVMSHAAPVHTSGYKKEKPITESVQ